MEAELFAELPTPDGWQYEPTWAHVPAPETYARI
jgi:hypothetical protein